MDSIGTAERYRRAKYRVPWRVHLWLQKQALAAGRYLTPLEEVRVTPGPGAHSLLAVGDIAGCTPVEENYLRGGHQAWGAVLPLLKSADICVGNLESVLTGQRQPRVPCGAKLRVDPAFVASLAGVFDGFTTANNHSFDFGPEGLLESLEHLRSAGIAACGTGRDNASAWQPCRFETGDVRVGMIGCCDRFSGFAEYLTQAAVALCEPEMVRAAIGRLRAEVDLVVVQVHWGYEFSLWPLASHRSMARSFVDAGADVVLCHHAHVPMGIEAHGRGVIAYGLGNFLFRQDQYQVEGSPWTKRTIALRVEFDKQGVRRALPVPVEMQSDHQIRQLEGEPRREMLGVLGHISRRIEDTESLENLEHHCRMQEMLDFWGYFRPSNPKCELESRYRADALNNPVWRSTISYLQSGAGAMRESGDLLERIRLAARAGDRKVLTDCGQEAETRALAARLVKQLDLIHYQPATTPWWLI